MEKKEALREYCIEKAIEIARALAICGNPSTKDVLKTAKELESYITAEDYK